MGKISKFVKVREVLQGEIAKILHKQEEAVKDEDYEMAALWKGFKETLHLINDIVKENDKTKQNDTEQQIDDREWQEIHAVDNEARRSAKII